MSFLLAPKAGDLCKWGLAMSGRHSGSISMGGGFIIEVGLPRFLIEQARDNIVNSEGRESSKTIRAL